MFIEVEEVVIDLYAYRACPDESLMHNVSLQICIVLEKFTHSLYS